MAEFVVERTEMIEAKPEKVFPHVGNLKKWNEWSPWAKLDPDMETTYEGEEGAVGSSYRWVGNRKVGEGQMTLKEVVESERVAIDLKFLKPFKSQNLTELELTPSDDATKVTWRMTGPQTFMTKVMGFIGKDMDKMVGPDFEKGLGNLKKLVEN